MVSTCHFARADGGFGWLEPTDRHSKSDRQPHPGSDIELGDELLTLLINPQTLGRVSLPGIVEGL